MYRIMIVKSKRDNYKSLYQYLTTTTEDGDEEILEIETKEELDTKVESMLNDEGYAKSAFIVVNTVDYVIDATDYSDEATDNETVEATESTESADEGGDENEDGDVIEEDSDEIETEDEEPDESTDDETE